MSVISNSSDPKVWFVKLHAPTGAFQTLSRPQSFFERGGPGHNTGRRINKGLRNILTEENGRLAASTVIGGIVGAVVGKKLVLDWVATLYIQGGLTAALYGFMVGFDSPLTPDITPPGTPRGGHGGSSTGVSNNYSCNSYKDSLQPEGHTRQLGFIEKYAEMSDSLESQAPVSSDPDEGPVSDSIIEGGLVVIVILVFFCACQVIVSWFCNVWTDLKAR